MRGYHTSSYIEYNPFIWLSTWYSVQAQSATLMRTQLFVASEPFLQ